MKLDELLNKPLPWKRDELTKALYSANFTAGKREIRFYAHNEEADYGMGDEGEWIIEFGEIQADGTSAHHKTMSGNEFDVFATLKAIIQDFIEQCNPKVIAFSAEKDRKNNRSRVYAKLFQKNLPAGWRLEKDETIVAHEPVFFKMVREGMMKRSDPYISGEKSGPRPPEMKLAPQPVSAHKSKLQTLMRKSGKSMEKVEAAWNKAVRETPGGPAKWANVMKRAKADPGISV